MTQKSIELSMITIFGVAAVSKKLGKKLPRTVDVLLTGQSRPLGNDIRQALNNNSILCQYHFSIPNPIFNIEGYALKLSNGSILGDKLEELKQIRNANSVAEMARIVYWSKFFPELAWPQSVISHYEKELDEDLTGSDPENAVLACLNLTEHFGKPFVL